MYPDKNILSWRLALTSIERGLPALLLYVLESKGSSPGRQGFFMVVNAAGEVAGSIGGGIMEHKFTEMARERLKEGGDLLALRRQVHDKDGAKDRSGMICSGEQSIFMYSFRPEDTIAVSALVGSLERCERGCLRLSPAGLAFSLEPPALDFYFDKRSEEDWVFIEKTGFKDRLFVVGAGHCGLAFSRIMRTMDFFITVFDHRPLLETFLRNEYAHEKILLEDYAELGKWIGPGAVHHYVVVMTQGYRTDDQAVRVLLPMDLRYFGLLGSKKKIEKMMGDYRSEGMDEGRLGKVRAPAGLPIRSQTPEEIAISIAAEIVQVKHAAGPSST